MRVLRLDFSRINKFELISFACLAYIVIETVQFWINGNVKVLPDLSFTYFPAAERLWQEGFGFLKDEKSIHVSFLSYGIPSLLQRKPEVMSYVYHSLIFVSFWSVWWFGKQANSLYGGALASVLFLMMPKVVEQFDSIGLGPLVITFQLVLMRAIYLLYQTKKNKYFFYACAYAVCFLLVRHVDWYFMMVVFIACGLAILLKFNNRHFFTSMLILSAVYLCVGAGIMYKNKQLFGYSGIATGGAAGVYLGVHPFTGGVNPLYLGTTFGLGPIPQNGTHLSVASESRLMSVSKEIIKDRSTYENVIFFINKFRMLIIDSETLPDRHHLKSYLKTISLVLLVFLFFVNIRKPWIWLLAAWVGYRLSILTVVMYEERYSTSLLDPILLVTLLVGIVQLVKSDTKIQLSMILILILITCFVYVEKNTFRMQYPSSNHEGIVEFSHSRFDQLHVEADGASREGNRIVQQASNSTIIVDLPDYKKGTNKNVLTSVGFSLVSGRCENSRVRLAKNDTVIYEAKFTPSRIDKIRIGHVSTPPFIENLKMEIRMNCDEGAIFKLGDVFYYSDNVSIFYAKKVLGWSL